MSSISIGFSNDGNRSKKQLYKGLVLVIGVEILIVDKEN